MTILKQSVGIDISKASFTACICTSELGKELHFTAVKKFQNEKTGFNQVVRWVRKQCSSEAPTVFLMEATGVYHERLALHLAKLKQTVHVVLPNKSKHFFASLNIKSKTDAIDARVLSQFGVERNHKAWQPPSKQLYALRDLTRFHVQLQEQRTAFNNMLESKLNGHQVDDVILKGNKKIIAQLDKQIEAIKKQIKTELAKDPELEEKVYKVATIKGVGWMTVTTVVAETMGFAQFTSIRQVTGYAGYDVVENQSGTSIKGQTRISKKGNRYIRNAMYFPAMVASRFNPELKATYLRIVQRKPSKMIAQVAIQRKILALIYTLWKNDSEYIEDYKNKVASTKTAEATLGSSTRELLSES